MKEMLTLGQMLTVHARVLGDASGARDLERSMSFRQWNDRSCRLGNALLGLGLAKGERVAVLAYNCVEWLEIFAATAKAGLIALPINFRLTGADMRYIVENAEATALIVQDELLGLVEEVRADLPIPPDRLIHFGKAPCPAGYRAYEDLIAAASDREPEQQVTLADPWTLMYTSGTTGKPKGVLRSHQAAVLLSLFTDIELGLHRRDGALLVMPMCHANSLNFFGAFAYCGGETAVYSRKSFDPEHAVATLADGGSTFTSLRQGMSQFVSALEKATTKQGVTIAYGARVNRVRASGAGIAVTHGTTTFECDKVVLACPPAAASALLGEVAPDVARDVAKIGFGTSATVHLAYERHAVEHALDGSGFIAPAREGRSISAGTFVSSKWEGRALSTRLSRSTCRSSFSRAIVASRTGVTSKRRSVNSTTSSRATRRPIARGCRRRSRATST